MTILQLSEAHIIGAVISFLLSIFIVPVVIYFSKKQGLVDNPGERKIHEHPVPRLGGVAVWLSTMLTFLFLVFLSYYPYGSLLSGILLGSSLMFLLGLIDDIYCLDAKFKLFIQLSIATIVYCLGIRIEDVYLPFGLSFHLGFLSWFVTTAWIVGVSNAVNFIDGIDGLAGSVISVSAVTLGLISAGMSVSGMVSPLIAFILAGAMLAFLTYNFNPAKIFMGDSGALFSGFLLATLSITGVMQTASIAMWIPVLVLSVPVVDITFASVRRILKGKSPFVADAEHIHHRLLKAGFSQNKAVLLLTGIAVLSGALSVLLINDSIIKYFLYAMALAAVMLLLNFQARK
ncbi:undecaprenyl/decaprenyl-phosphate alpha-N-acetylglucosaminyl 1-phosphate transferase [bacterium]|nr:undecaprenyl/decaprenyl-phosphate alpha-N-acetylglucosaminyl 1-phosphate transferase [bacterium]